MDFTLYTLKLLHTGELLTMPLMSESSYVSKNKKTFIYCWMLKNSDNTFTPMYVGQTTTGKRRWNQERNRNGCIALYNGIHAHPETLAPYIIKFVAEEDLNYYEQLFYLKFYTDSQYNGYNIKIPAQHRKTAPELVNKIKILLQQGKTYKYIKEQLNCKIELMRAVNLGHSWQDDTLTYPINKYAGKSTFKELGNKKVIGRYDANGQLLASYSSILQAAKASQITTSTIRRMCEGQYGFFRYDRPELLPKQIIIIEHARKVKGVINQYNLDGNFIQSFASVKEAARKTKISRTHINGCVLGKEPQAGGFLWRRQTEPTEQVAVINHTAKTGRFGGKLIGQFSLDGTLICTFKSVNEAARQTNYNCSNIARAARTNGTASGYYWKYL